jgi:hypothetical protein
MSEYEMSPEDRLRAADPAAGAVYRHGDEAAMLARITDTPRVARVGLANGLRLRVGTAAAAAALVTVGGIAALQAASPSLSVLALGGHVANTRDGAAAMTPSTALMRLAENYTFVAGPDLTTGIQSAPSYVLSAPGDFAVTSAQIAAALGVTGEPSDTPAANSFWTIGDTNGDYVSFWADSAELNWQFTNVADESTVSAVTTVPSTGGDFAPSDPETPNSGSEPSESTTTAMSVTGIDDSAALTLAQEQLSSLGVTGTFGTPIFDTEGPFENGESWTDVAIPWEVGGPGTGFEFDFSFDPSGTLVSASGVDVSVTQGSDYPLLSEVDGVSALQKQQDSFSGGPIRYEPVTTSTDETGGLPVGAGSSSGSPGDTVSTVGTAPDSTLDTTPGTTSDTAPTTDPTVSVTLDSVAIQYSEYTLNDGTEVQLPQYVYTGDDGSNWTVLAVNPHFVQVDSANSVEPMIY